MANDQDTANLLQTVTALRETVSRQHERIEQLEHEVRTLKQRGSADGSGGYQAPVKK